MSETDLVRHLMIKWSASGMKIFRNQCGSYQLPDGRWLSSGLCVGSSDLIGWTPVIVTASMLDRPLAVFTAIECKVGKHDTTVQQARFLARVREDGGLGVVARSSKDVAEAVRRFTT